jgi:hypothetical protein
MASHNLEVKIVQRTGEDESLRVKFPAANASELSDNDLEKVAGASIGISIGVGVATFVAGFTGSWALDTVVDQGW